MNRNILSPCNPELFDLLDILLPLSWAITPLTNVRKRILAKPTRNHLTTQSVTNLATQPEKQPDDTARKTALTRPGRLAAHNGLEATFTGNRH